LYFWKFAVNGYKIVDDSIDFFSSLAFYCNIMVTNLEILTWRKQTLAFRKRLKLKVFFYYFLVKGKFPWPKGDINRYIFYKKENTFKICEKA